MAEWDQADRAARRVEEEFGPVDVWVNNAFTAAFGRFTDVSPDEFLQATRSTYFGYVHGTRAALDRMVPRDRGTVVQVGSALAYRGIPAERLLRRQARPAARACDPLPQPCSASGQQHAQHPSTLGGPGRGTGVPRGRRSVAVQSAQPA
ncbi:SDR family NAD(P)-dependent oxidoreductase [Streptomyces sp. WG4]|uniref:SDR family NAD(P)-dependent oxidoreductase n=1 Tax=Streptomyces sp. WG4 TaxID=3417649 RepID=UPI003CFA8A29